MQRRNKPVAFLAASAFSFAAALGLEWALNRGLERWPAVWAGWLAALLVLGIFHLLLMRAKAPADQPATMRALALIGVRLLALIILVIIVLVTRLFDAASFVVGLCAAYFLWSWTELALLRAINN